MNIPKYWARENQEVIDATGRPFLAQCWRWSNAGYGEARRSARDAMRYLITHDTFDPSLASTIEILLA